MGMYKYINTHTYTHNCFRPDIVQPPDYIRSEQSLSWEWVIGVKVIKAFKAEGLEEALSLPRKRE